MSMSPTRTRVPPLATGLDLGDGAAEIVFDAMGTQAHVVVVDGGGGLPADARRFVDELEDRWSRFRPTSDVSRLNRADGNWVQVHPDTLMLLERARTGWQVTDGWFDPTVLPAIVAAGYDTTFEVVAGRSDPAPIRDGAAPEPDRRTDGPGPAPGLARLELDRRCSRVRLPSGVGVDPGAIGKGLAADLVVDRMLDLGAAGAMANVGGDLRVAGRPPVPAGWGVEVAIPGSNDTLLLGLAEAGVATSTPAYRRWQREGRVVHHLVDPHTGRPAAHPAWSATVVAGAGWLAEVLATSLVLGAPPDHLLTLGATGFVTDDAGRVQRLPGLEEYLR